MRSITLTGVILTWFCTAIWSQTFQEAVGKTTIFSLKAGEKSQMVGVLSSKRDQRIPANVSLKCISGGYILTLPTNHSGAEISLYTISGKQIYCQRNISSSSVRLETTKYAYGLYAAHLRLDGKNYLYRVVITGKGN